MADDLAPVFLVGPQRSGTTALGMVIADAVHAQGGCFTVNGKLPYLLRRWWRREDAAFGHLRADEVEHALKRRPPLGPETAAWLDRASTALRASAGRSSEMRCDVIEEIRRVCRETYAARFWGDKYNEYLLELDWLAEVLPAARWIFLVRDPVETVSSVLRWRGKPWNPCNAEAALAKWTRWTGQWPAFRGSLTPQRRFEIDYDALCAGRRSGLEAFLDLDLAPAWSFSRRPSDVLAFDVSGEAIEVTDELHALGLLPGG